MSTPRICVDFNEMPCAGEVLLSQEDSKIDSSGSLVHFHEGKEVTVYMDDCDENGNPDRLIAKGNAMRNGHGGWTAAARWLLKIDEDGIRHESETHRHG